MRISGSNAGYTMFRGSVKGTSYPLHSLSRASPRAITFQLESDTTYTHHSGTGALDIISGPFIQCQKLEFPSKHLPVTTVIHRRFSFNIKVTFHVAFCDSIFALYCSKPYKSLYHVSLLLSVLLYQLQAWVLILFKAVLCSPFAKKKTPA